MTKKILHNICSINGVIATFTIQLCLFLVDFGVILINCFFPKRKNLEVCVLDHLMNFIIIRARFLIHIHTFVKKIHETTPFLIEPNALTNCLEYQWKSFTLLSNYHKNISWPHRCEFSKCGMNKVCLLSSFLLFSKNKEKYLPPASYLCHLKQFYCTWLFIFFL